MKQTPGYLALTISMLIIACNTSRNLPRNETATTPRNITINGKLFTTIFQQKSAEYRALCYQAYNAARMQINTYKAPDSRPLALITDIDETIFDNSAYAVHRGLQGKDYEPVSWYQYTDMAIADTMPGTGSFLKYAAAQGVEIFYITNREPRERNGTLKNLQRFGLPNADDAHLLTIVDVSSKERRRTDVSKTHNIVLLMGDNLADFSSMFDKKPQDERKNNTDLSATYFGNKFIVLPNPVYGDWEGALNRYNYTLSAGQKDSIIKEALKGY